MANIQYHRHLALHCHFQPFTYIYACERGLELPLQSDLYMKQHVSLNSIADHILETKALDTSSLQHLDACTECQSDFQWLKVLRNLSQSDLQQKTDAA
jgi:hypothetical protein